MQKKFKSISLGFPLSILAFIMAGVAIVGYRLEQWQHPMAFKIFVWATVLAFIAFIFSIGSFKSSKVKAFMGIVLTLPILLGTFLFNYSATLYPNANELRKKGKIRV